MREKFRLSHEVVARAMQQFLRNGCGHERGQFPCEASSRSLNHPVCGIGAAFRAWIADDFVIETVVKLAGPQRLERHLRADASGVAQGNADSPATHKSETRNPKSEISMNVPDSIRLPVVMIRVCFGFRASNFRIRIVGCTPGPADL